MVIHQTFLNGGSIIYFQLFKDQQQFVIRMQTSIFFTLKPNPYPQMWLGGLDTSTNNVI